MSWGLRRRSYVTIALGLAVVIQLPALLAVGRLLGPWVALGVAALAVAPTVATVRNPWEQRAGSHLRLALVMWPFFTWWTMCAVFLGLGPLALLVAALTPVSLDRALAVAGGAAMLLGLRAMSRRPRVCRHEIAVAGLPPAFAGYRIAQISDIHCGPFTPAGRVRRWVNRVNRVGADLVTVTGDLITSGADYVPTVAACLGELRARDGVFGCMGNHDYFTNGEQFARELERRGLRLLRNTGHVIERGGARLYLAGVDDTWTHRDDLARAMKGRPVDAPTVLLAHDPALFPAAATHGVALTLSGHTHGGQLASPIAPKRWNLARFITPFTSGIYRLGHSSLYVNRGLGTTGPPIRLVARPEIAVFTLVPGDAALGERLQHFAEDVIREASEAR